MILKVLLVIGVIGIVYFFFIKKKPSSVTNTTRKDDVPQANEMVECVSCGVYIEINEAILSNAKYYCSNECIKQTSQMLFFGHRFLQSDNFYHVNSIEAITNTPPSCALYIEFDEANLDVIEHFRVNAITFALSVRNINELMYASSLDASYIIVKKELAKTAQNIAESYLFDAKVLVTIENEDEIEECALLGVDGVIFSNAIIKINS